MEKDNKDKLYNTASELMEYADNNTYIEMLNDLMPDLADLIEEALYNSEPKFLEGFIKEYSKRVKVV